MFFNFLFWMNCEGLEKVVEKIKDTIPKIKWDFKGIHYFDGGPLSIQYLLVLDALNFCFWPGMLITLLQFISYYNYFIVVFTYRVID